MKAFGKFILLFFKQKYDKKYNRENGYGFKCELYDEIQYRDLKVCIFY